MSNNYLKLSFLAAVFFLTCISSKNFNNDIFDYKYLKLPDNMYVGIFEVTNDEYKEFINDLKTNKKLDEALQYYPDTTLWRTKFPYAFTKPYTDNYFAHSSFGKYPVVNITKADAEAYCNWLSNQYNSKPKRKFDKVKFRLPTEKEWIEFAGTYPENNLPWYGKYAYDPNLNYYANIKFVNKVPENGSFSYDADGALTTQEVGKYKPNRFGIYDIIGNVAEITQEGVIKGGSWDNTIDECVINKAQDIQAPDPRIGFRVIMIVEKN